MSKVSISEAARLVGISRQHLYKRFITPGVLTVEKDGESPPVVDTSELLRVFGELKGQQAASHGDPVLLAELEALRREVADKDAQLREAREREQWLRQHASEVAGSLRLLEDMTGEADTAARLNKARDVIKQYKEALTQTKERLAASREALAVERGKGFWKRLFN